MTEPTHNPVLAVERVEPTRMHPLVQAAMAHNPDPATLRELLAVQREWEAGEAKKEFTRALVALKRDLPAVIRKDVGVSHDEGVTIKFRHTSLAEAMRQVDEPLAKHGFSLSWRASTPTPALITVTSRLTHAGGHSEEMSISAPPDVSGKKSSIQAIGSTITYLQRYSALALLGIATADMKEPGDNGDAPVSEATAEHVNAAFNLQMAGKLKKYGKTVPDAETFLGRKCPDWTRTDLDRLKAWLEPTSQPATPWAMTPERILELHGIVTARKIPTEAVKEITRRVTAGRDVPCDANVPLYTEAEFGALKSALDFWRPAPVASNGPAEPQATLPLREPGEE